MEITIKTLDQAREQRVTVEVVPGQTATVEVNGRALYPSELDWAAVRAERDEARGRAARRERRITELEAELARERHQRACDLEVVQGQREALEEEASAGRRQILTLGDELISERERADRLNERNAKLERELADARRAIDILSGQLGRVSGAVHRPELQDAIRASWDSNPDVWAMKNAIRQVRDALGSPSPPSRATSQA